MQYLLSQSNLQLTARDYHFISSETWQLWSVALYYKARILVGNNKYYKVSVE